MNKRVIQVMVASKSAFSLDEVEKVKADFASKGVELIVVLYGNNAIRPPEFLHLDSALTFNVTTE